MIMMLKRSVLIGGLALSAAGVFCQPVHQDIFSEKYITAMIEKTADWQLQHPKHDPKDWTNGAFYAGMTAAWQTTNSSKIYDALIQIGEAQQWQPFKRWYHADDIAVCQTYIDLYRTKKDPGIIRPTIDTIDLFLSRPYPQKSKVETIKWWWCDALFMAPPVLVKLAAVTHDRKYLEANDLYFRQTYELLYDKEEHLFARDLNYVIKPDGTGKKESNGKKIFWSRGNGWVMGGLVRVLQELPQNYSKRAFYESLLIQMAGRVAQLQQPDGLWRASLLNAQAYPGGEVSGSGFFCYALAWGINNKLLDKKKFEPIVRKAWRGLVNCVDEYGRVGWVQPIGASPGKGFNEDSWEVYGTGAFLFAASEVLKLKK